MRALLCRIRDTANVLIASILIVQADVNNSSDESARVPDRPIPLFNGRDLSGFTTWLVDTHRADPRRVFSVTNGWLRISGEGLGYLATVQRYRDYRLVVEFKWGERNWSWGDRVGKARDSGIFLHAQGPDGNSDDGQGAFMAAIECNVFQGATGDILLIRGRAADGSRIAPRLRTRVTAADAEGWPTWDPDGRWRELETWGRLNWRSKSKDWRDQLDFRGPHDLEKPGEWNQVECNCVHDRVVIRVNGVQVNEASELNLKSGKILLQCEGSEIYFRRVELLPLKPNLAP